MLRQAPRIATLAAAALLTSVAPILSQSTAELAKGKLLVAREDMRDPNFERTVVLVVAYGEAGAMGVVLNRPSHMRLDHLLPHLGDAAGLDETVYLGGPVATRNATILFSAAESTGRAHVLGDVYMTGELDLLERLVTDPRPDERYRVFAGHAGWAPGQLDVEMLRLSWHVLPASEEMIFGNVENLWPDLIRRTRSRMAGAPTAAVPARPTR